VWAPNALRVAVIGAFNGWDGRCHGMRFRHGCGVWEIFIPDVSVGTLYKFEIKAGTGALLTDKCDPLAFQVERSPGSAAIVCDLGKHAWGDAAWMQARAKADARTAPLAIYEAHLGSWRRKPEEGHRPLSYPELAETLVDYVRDLAFTHVQLLPIGEFDFDASLGFQPFAPFAPTSRWGAPDGLQLLVDRCHRAGVGVILDWVPNHFSDDPHGLRSFDGTHLYEHPDPQRRHHPGSSRLVYDYGRREVADYLLGNALFWLDKYHVDGLAVGQLATMLYLDYGRSRGEWTPNRFGGHENLDAIDFLRRLNDEIHARGKGAITIGEDNSGWPRLSHPTHLGGLGFGFKWNLDWVRDTLRYLSRNAVHRKYYHDELIHTATKAYDENFITPLSHHEVGFGRGSLLHKMTGDRWQRFATLRACYGLMYAEPGKKLLFMGNEFGQEREWNSDISLDWHLLDDPLHVGVQALVRDLNTLYRATPALHERDCETGGFEWVDCNDTDQSVITFLRRGHRETGSVVVASHFTPVPRRHYRIGVPLPGVYREVMNTDAAAYGGGDNRNETPLTASAEPMHGRPYSIAVTLPPLATVMLAHAGA
jgi:1,4-alpha-glucan branching enzyme